MPTSSSNQLACGRYVTELLRSELLGEQPPEKPKDISFDELYQMAKMHGLETMTYDAVSKLEYRPEPLLWSRWRSSRDANSAKNMVQRSQRDRILQELSRRGIDVLPLKGSLLIEMYPKPDQRQMSDLDILIRREQRGLVRQVMVDLGYQVDRFEITNEDTYSQKPFMHIEMHHQLFTATSPLHQLREYYSDPWLRSIPDEGTEHCYHFSWEDYYIYLLSHFYKHFAAGGCGIRNVMDIYVVLDKYGDYLDEDYLEKELDKLGLSKFRETMEQLARQWFSPDCHEKTVDEKIERTLFTSGAYGFRDNSRRGGLQRMEEKYSSEFVARSAYILSLMFPSYERLIVKYPQFKGHQRILPLLWLYHIGYKILFDRERIVGNIRVMRQASQDQRKRGQRNE